MHDPAKVLGLFRSGLDTAQIAKIMHIQEARASKLLWVARCHERGLPATFLTRSREVRNVLHQSKSAA